MRNVITVEHLAKRYRLGQKLDRHATFRDLMVTAATQAAKTMLRPGRSQPDADTEFWALRDVSFSVKDGDRLGIVGRNGAGKSTLLKILSRITPPTSGQARINGRVASLLEVGTGFHPELSGRENIYLNGAILGMSRQEISRKFDEIVAFADIARFLDTPVKRYSSGMYVRLAFSVAAHLEPDILIVDEVLAVGDVEFQKKCLGKMEDVSKEGRTVLFVSHNMTSLLALTNRCILLTGGSVSADGPSSEVIAAYQSTYKNETLGRTELADVERYGNGKARFTSIRMRPLARGSELEFAVTGCDLEFTLDIEARAYFQPATVAITLYDDLGARLIDVSTILKGDALSLKSGQRATAKFVLRNVLLNGGNYTAGLWLGIANQEDIDGVRYATSFRVEHRREDILYSTPFPGPYVCEFSHTVDVHEGSGSPA